MVKSPIVARINALLVERGIDKQTFFDACGLTSATYSQWNTGKIKNPRTKSLQRIADYLNVSLEFILCGEKGAKTEKDIKKDLPEEVDAITQALLDFAKNGTQEQKEDALQYIQFLKSKRPKD